MDKKFIMTKDEKAKEFLVAQGCTLLKQNSQGFFILTNIENLKLNFDQTDLVFTNTLIF